MGPKKLPKKRWNLDNNELEKFITSLSEYRNGEVQAQARVAISREFNWTPEEVKDTWQYLKDRYTKERKALNQKQPSGSGTITAPFPSWLFKQMK